MSETITTPSKPRILVVDDHPNTAVMLARVLEKLDNTAEVLTARSGEEALEQISDGLVDILITDFMMPGMSGLDLIEKLKGKQEATYTILITAYDTPGLSVSARRLGVKDYLTKPVQPEKIREIVARVLSEIHPVSPQSNEPVQPVRPFKILIADDYKDNVRLLSVRLRSEGYDFVVASDGFEALELARKEKPDLILLDVNMPHKDGFQVMAELRADPEIQHIPVIMITAARIAPRDVREGLILGADDYVTKPLDWRELAARIQSKLRVKQAEDVLRRRNKELGLLPEIGRDLNAHMRVQELSQVVLNRTVEALGECHAHLVLFRPGGDPCQTAYEAQVASSSALQEMQRQLTEDGLALQVVRQKQAAMVEDVLHDSRWKNTEGSLRSAVCVPLSGRLGITGVLTLGHEKPDYFRPEHVNLLQAVADQAAIAIENAQLYDAERKRIDQLVALNQVSRRISLFVHSSDLLEELPVLIHQVLNFPTVALWMSNGHPLSLHSIAGRQNGSQVAQLEAAPLQAARRGRSVQWSVDETEAHAASSNGGGEQAAQIAQSVIAVPIHCNGQVSAVLSIHSQQDGAFKDSDRVVLETLAAQIGMALERVRLFESVEQEQRRLAAVLDGAGDAILVMDPEGALELANPAGERLFTDIDTRVGQELPRGFGYDELLDLLEENKQTGKRQEGQVDWPDERTFSVQVTPITEGGQVATLHDVSHFKALNQLKNEFIATASHDLKNPIFAVLGYSDLLKKAGPLNAMQEDFVNRIRNSAVQMQDLVLNLLEISRIEMGVVLQREPLDVYKLLCDQVEEFSAQAAAKGQTLDLAPGVEGVLVNADKSRLQQVLRNLIGNAIKYTPENGQVWVRLEGGPNIQIEVQDSGIGIAPDDLPHIFDKFYRVRSQETDDIEGNGLGLAIVKSIVEKHGGQISVDSTPGQGSCFRVVLPAYKQNLFAPAEKQQSAGAVAANPSSHTKPL